jgi:hemolysin III
MTRSISFPQDDAWDRSLQETQGASAIGLVLGWVAVAAFGQLLKLPVAGLVLLLIGGLLYSAGAVVYARRRPDPIPHILGYHEVFHAPTVGAAACQYAAIVFFVLPRA